MKRFFQCLFAVLMITVLLLPLSGVHAQSPSAVVTAANQSIVTANAQSSIQFTINRPPSQWSVMLQKRQWWGWETLHFRNTGDYRPFYGLSSGTYRVQISKWSGWETCSPSTVSVNGWNSQMVTCIG